MQYINELLDDVTAITRTRADALDSAVVGNICEVWLPYVKEQLGVLLTPSESCRETITSAVTLGASIDGIAVVLGDILQALNKGALTEEISSLLRDCSQLLPGAIEAARVCGLSI